MEAFKRIFNIKNEKERPDWFDVIYIISTQMKGLGTWPVKNETLWYKTKCWFWIILGIVFNVFIVAEVLVPRDDFSSVSEVLAWFLSTFSYIVKVSIYMWKREKFVYLLKHLQKNDFLRHPKIFDKFLKRAVNQTNSILDIFQYTCYISISLVAVRPLLLSDNVLPIRFTYVHGYCVYPMYVLQVVGLLSACRSNSCLDVLLCGLMNIASTNFYIIGEKLKHARKWANLSEDDICNGKINSNNELCNEMDEATVKNIVRCIKDHHIVLDFVTMIQDMFSLILLVQFIESVIVICFSGFQMAVVTIPSVDFWLMAIYFVSMNIQVVIYCWFGNEVILMSLKIRDNAYHIDWVNCGPKVRKYLFIIMERAKKPSYLTAGNFAQLSLRAFGQIINSSYSYFALMQRMYKDT